MKPLLRISLSSFGFIEGRSEFRNQFNLTLDSVFLAFEVLQDAGNTSALLGAMKIAIIAALADIEQFSI